MNAGKRGSQRNGTPSVSRRSAVGGGDSRRQAQSPSSVRRRLKSPRMTKPAPSALHASAHAPICRIWDLHRTGLLPLRVPILSRFAPQQPDRRCTDRRRRSRPCAVTVMSVPQRWNASPLPRAFRSALRRYTRPPPMANPVPRWPRRASARPQQARLRSIGGRPDISTCQTETGNTRRGATAFSTSWLDRGRADWARSHGSGGCRW